MLALAAASCAGTDPAPQPPPAVVKRPPPGRGARDLSLEGPASDGVEGRLPSALSVALASEIGHKGAKLSVAKALGTDPCGTTWWSIDVAKPPVDGFPSGRERLNAASTGAESWAVVRAGAYDWDNERLMDNGIALHIHLETREELRRLDDRPSLCGLLAITEETVSYSEEGRVHAPTWKQTVKLMHVSGGHVVHWAKVTGVCEGDCVQVNVELNGAGKVTFSRKRGDPSLLGITPGCVSVRDSAKAC